eukprot:322737-Chlamydomonas_euryale.AAC.3
MPLLKLGQTTADVDKGSSIPVRQNAAAVSGGGCTAQLPGMPNGSGQVSRGLHAATCGSAAGLGAARRRACQHGPSYADVHHPQALHTLRAVDGDRRRGLATGRAGGVGAGGDGCCVCPGGGRNDCCVYVCVCGWVGVTAAVFVCLAWGDLWPLAAGGACGVGPVCGGGDGCCVCGRMRAGAVCGRSAARARRAPSHTNAGACARRAPSHTNAGARRALGACRHACRHVCMCMGHTCLWDMCAPWRACMGAYACGGMHAAGWHACMHPFTRGCIVGQCINAPACRINDK